MKPISIGSWVRFDYKMCIFHLANRKTVKIAIQNSERSKII